MATDAGTIGSVAFGRGYLAYGSTDLGLVDSISINWNAKVSTAMAAKYGEIPIKAVNDGCAPVITVAMREHSAANLARGLPGAVVASSAISCGGSTGGAVSTDSLTICPLSGVADPVASVVFAKVFALITGPTVYETDSDRLVTVDFVAMWDSTKDAGKEIFTTTATDSTAPGIDSVTILGGAALDGSTPAATADFDIQFDEEVHPVSGSYGDTIKLLNITDDALVALTFTTSKVSATEYHVYIDPGTMTAEDELSLLIGTGIADVHGNKLAAAQEHNFTIAT